MLDRLHPWRGRMHSFLSLSPCGCFSGLGMLMAGNTAARHASAELSGSLQVVGVE